MEIAETPEARARRYRRTAAHLRRQADAPEREPERGELLLVAEQYERIADRLSAKEKAEV
jgi:hypothetical protein